MERSDHPRVVVVGGGIIGSAIAMHLAERGLRPLLVDEDRAGEAASARSFASLSAFGNDPVAYYELACAALASWSRRSSGPVPGAIRSCRSTRRTCANCCRPPSPARSRLPATLHGTGRSRPTWSWPPAAPPRRRPDAAAGHHRA